MSDYRILVGDCREMLRTLPERSVHCVVTSPPYFGLRDYGLPPTVWGGEPECAHEWGDASGYVGHRGNRGQVPQTKWKANETFPQHTGTEQTACVRCGAWRGQLGLEPTPDLYVEHMVDVFREVWRVLRDDGVLWLNLGDTYAGSWGAQGRSGQLADRSVISARQIAAAPRKLSRTGSIPADSGLKPKDLIGIPWRVAFALQADGWTLRSDVVWAKPNPMPESVEDRPTKAHEYVFLLTKRARYFWDAEAVREPDAGTDHPRNVLHRPDPSGGIMPEHRGIRTATGRNGAGRNIRSVWTITTRPYRGAHFATFPPELAERCILAGTSERGCCPECGAPWERVVERTPMKIARSDRREQLGEYGRTQASGTMLEPARAETTGWRPGCECNAGDPVPCTVLDPFAGAGTTLLVASRRGRSGIGIELSPKYAEMARRRIEDDCPLFVAAETQTACDRTGTDR